MRISDWSSDVCSSDLLFGKLNPLLYQALEGATSFCKLRGNPYVELVHWIHQIVHTQDSDLHRIARRFDLDMGALQADLTRSEERRVGKECVSTCRSRWFSFHLKKKLYNYNFIF